MSLPANPTETLKRLNPHIYASSMATPLHADPKRSEQAIEVGNSKTIAALNKTERRFYDLLKANPAYQYVGIQDLTFRIGWRCRYTPDFSTRDGNGIVTLWEVKGFMRDDALVKIKVAARNWQNFHFFIARWQSGTWATERVAA